MAAAAPESTSSEALPTPREGRCRAVHGFAGHGPLLPGGLAAQGLARGAPFDEFDVLQGGDKHDLLLPEPRAALLQGCAEQYTYGHFGIPCTTFTILLALQRRVLRLRRAPWGRGGLVGRDAEQVSQANALIITSIEAMTRIVDRGGEVTFENVTDRGDVEIPECYWPKRASMCPLSLVPAIIAFMLYANIEQFHVPMGSFVDPDDECDGELPPVKWVTIFATPGAARILRPLSRRRMSPTNKPRAVAIGRDAAGNSRAALTAAYPAGFNTWLAMVAEVFAGSGRRDVPTAPPGAQIGCGSMLHPVMRAAVEAARSVPARFADFRKRDPAPIEERHLLPIPAPHSVDAEFDAPVSGADWAIVEEGTDDERPESFAPGFLRPLRSHHGIPGLPPGRVAYEIIFMRIAAQGGARVGYIRIVEWTRAAGVAAPLLAAGLPHVSPGTITVERELKEEWARDILLDTRQVHDVVRMRRSTRHTVFPGKRQMDRAAFRDLCDEEGWDEVDPDIVGQAGEGGIESRSTCPRYTILGWHHRGVRENFAEAHRISVQEHADGWLIGPYPMPPCEPCRCVPNNVLLQPKPFIGEDNELRVKLKARVTINESFGDADSPNAGTSAANRTTHLPSHQTHATSASVVDGCFRRAKRRGEQYCTDLTGAFSFLQEQRADWWLQVRFWIMSPTHPYAAAADVKGAFYFQPRTIFGGCWGPNRFMRVQRAKRSRVRRRQAAFDASQPYPEGVQQALHERRELQRRGLLPVGADQLIPSSLQEFIDDESGSTGDDPVVMPAELAHIDVSRIRDITRASGGRPSAANSRCMVHCCFSIDESERLSLEHALEKVQCGDCIVVLGLRCDIARDTSDCPPAKAAVVAAEMQLMQERVQQGLKLEREMVDRNVGRLSNVSQIDPGLLLHIHAGYALATATTHSKKDGQRHKLRSVPVSATSEVGAEFLRLSAYAIASLRANVGVPLAYAPSFPATDADGTLTECTDASGDDGVGGFAFHPARPGHVWIVWAPWEADVKEALAYSAQRIAARAAAPLAPACSMPAGETFGEWAVAETIRRTGVAVTAVVAIGDCKPAATAATLAKSRSAVMRALVDAMRTSAPAWLGVQVRRQWNTDADLLSHPATVQLVVEAATSAGLTVDVLPVHAECWRVLRAAIAAAHAAAVERRAASG